MRANICENTFYIQELTLYGMCETYGMFETLKTMLFQNVVKLWISKLTPFPLNSRTGVPKHPFLRKT